MSQYNKKNVIHCPKCEAPLLSQVALAEGSTFVIKCCKCDTYVRIQAGFNFIAKRILTEPKDTKIVTTEA